MSEYSDFEAALLVQLQRIVKALEAGNEQRREYSTRINTLEEEHPPEHDERSIVVQERMVKAVEERLDIDRQHNEMHLRGTAHGAPQ